MREHNKVVALTFSAATEIPFVRDTWLLKNKKETNKKRLVLCFLIKWIKVTAGTVLTGAARRGEGRDLSSGL